MFQKTTDLCTPVIKAAASQTVEQNQDTNLGWMSSFAKLSVELSPLDSM